MSDVELSTDDGIARVIAKVLEQEDGVAVRFSRDPGRLIITTAEPDGETHEFAVHVYQHF